MDNFENLPVVRAMLRLLSSSKFWALAFGAFIFRNEDLRHKHLIIAILVIVGAILIILH